MADIRNRMSNGRSMRKWAWRSRWRQHRRREGDDLHEACPDSPSPRTRCSPHPNRINGGLVVVVADDPGMHSSQNGRTAGIMRAAKLPMFEPADSQECRDFTWRRSAVRSMTRS